MNSSYSDQSSDIITHPDQRSTAMLDPDQRLTAMLDPDQKSDTMLDPSHPIIRVLFNALYPPLILDLVKLVFSYHLPRAKSFSSLDEYERRSLEDYYDMSKTDYYWLRDKLFVEIYKYVSPMEKNRNWIRYDKGEFKKIMTIRNYVDNANCTTSDKINCTTSDKFKDEIDIKGVDEKTGDDNNGVKDNASAGDTKIPNQILTVSLFPEEYKLLDIYHVDNITMEGYNTSDYLNIYVGLSIGGHFMLVVLYAVNSHYRLGGYFYIADSLEDIYNYVCYAVNEEHCGVSSAIGFSLKNSLFVDVCDYGFKYISLQAQSQGTENQHPLENGLCGYRFSEFKKYLPNASEKDKGELIRDDKDENVESKLRDEKQNIIIDRFYGLIGRSGLPLFRLTSGLWAFCYSGPSVEFEVCRSLYGAMRLTDSSHIHRIWECGM